MFRHFLAALVAAPLFLAACEDVTDTQVDPTCVSNCDPGETDDTGDPPELVDYAAKTTVNGVEEPCQLRYDSMDSDHKVETASGTTVGLREECYWLSLNTPNELHTRLSDGVRFIARPTVICVGDAANDERATREWSDLPLDPFFEGWFTCLEVHNQSGNVDDFQTLEVETAWLEWEYEGEWDQMVEATSNCLDFGNAGLYCFDGANTVIQYSYSGQFVERSKASSVSLEDSTFSYTSENGSYTTTCEAH